MIVCENNDQYISFNKTFVHSLVDFVFAFFVEKHIATNKNWRMLEMEQHQKRIAVATFAVVSGFLTD